MLPYPSQVNDRQENQQNHAGYPWSCSALHQHLSDRATARTSCLTGVSPCAASLRWCQSNLTWIGLQRSVAFKMGLAFRFTTRAASVPRDQSCPIGNSRVLICVLQQPFHLPASFKCTSYAWQTETVNTMQQRRMQHHCALQSYKPAEVTFVANYQTINKEHSNCNDFP